MVTTLTATQQQAIAPDMSVWLSAHAGTGKTKVLVDRILRLLLQGEAPGTILAITYTKAAAAEMQLRVRSKLAQWTVMETAELDAELSALLQVRPDETLRTRAQRLLFEVIDASSELSIQTIHGFCQSLLTRFPIEAGLSGSPEVIDNRQRMHLLQQAKERWYNTLSAAEAEEGMQAKRALLMTALGEYLLDEVISELLLHSSNVFAVLNAPDGIRRYCQALAEGLGLDMERTESDWLAEQPIKTEQAPPLIDLLSQQSNKTDPARADSLHRFFTHKSESALEAYLVSWVKADGEPLKQPVTAGFAKAHPALGELCMRERDWAADFLHWRANRRTVEVSIVVAELVIQLLLDEYDALKQERCLLDFSDVIRCATHLLSRPGYCEWVLSRLDRQVKHILLDEAQDTSPEQWSLLRLLTNELFVPELYDSSPRTLFVVGDPKQSIYRFQGADPKGFAQHASHYGHWFSQTGQGFTKLSLDQSFRSTDAVLALVNQLCSLPDVREALQDANAEHGLHRSGHAGGVTLWPWIEEDSKSSLVPPWELDEPDYVHQQTGEKLAVKLAEDVARRIDEGTAKAKDVLVLVQRRSAFIGLLSRELLRRGVPVAGADRLALHQHLAVHDIMALAEWCLLPQDDLTLATLLKGPLFRWDEPRLFDLAYARDGCLWDALQRDKASQQEVASLSALMEAAHRLPPYEWMCLLLDRFDMAPALRNQFGLEADDIVYELKQEALRFEANEGKASLAVFMQWFRVGELDIKRDMEQGQNAVRIMTVHGAKGLQAPLVYLPDTVRKPQKRSHIIWHSHRGMPLAYVPPQGGLRSPQLKAMQHARHEAELAEYARLLYVALTRAENELVIAGYHGGVRLPDECWYGLVEQAMQQLGCSADAEGMYRYATGETPANQASTEPCLASPLPDWCKQSLPASTATQTILSPSELVPYSHDEETSGDGKARLRGDLTHRLLQLLPPAESACDAETLLQAARLYSPDFPEPETIVQEVLTIHRQFSWLFATESLPEVMVQGRVYWQGESILLRGQIDRLVVETQRIVIVDYKSNRCVPEAMPQAYLAQLAAYSALLAPHYPNHTIAAALLWTATGHLQWADSKRLKALCQASSTQLDSPAA